MKKESSGILLDFPSLSSLTITSNSDEQYSYNTKNESQKSFTVTTIEVVPSLTEQKQLQQELFNAQQKRTNKKQTKCQAIIQQFKLFLNNNIKPNTTTTTTNNTSFTTSIKNHKKHHHHNKPRLLSQYGQLQRRQIGTGASATVRLTKRQMSDGKIQTYAIKAFRKRKAKETGPSFMKKLISEFCISSTLDHPNIVKTFDLVVDDKNRYCTVMEYCSGGDLYSFIKDGHLTNSVEEVNGYFKQLLNGLSYLHSIGVAHRDIKPENLLLVKQKKRTILKITDFGEADVFREAWQPTSRLSDGLCGSTPYIAPEIFLNHKKGYEASQSDIWSVGIVYFCMRLNGVPFYSAQKSDANYRLYGRCLNKKVYPAFEVFEKETKEMVYGMLEPNPTKRMTVNDLLKLTWVADIELPI